jgi:hypothetical protein
MSIILDQRVGCFDTGAPGSRDGTPCCGLLSRTSSFGVTTVLATGFLFNAAGVQHSTILQWYMSITALAMIDIMASIMASAPPSGSVQCKSI